MISIEDLSITVIEPSIMQGRVIIKHLNELGVKNVQYYETGKDALDFMKKFPPDLAISAMYLSDMTGTELVLAIRSTPEIENTPYMLISSETSFASLDPIKQAGVVAILPKPFDRNDLKRALYATLDFLEPEDDSENEPVLANFKVLVVDDSPLARKHISLVLKNIGIENIDTAENGKEAIAKIETSFFDLIVTDYNMPEMDGEELTRYVRERSAQRSIPILMVTSESSENRLSAVQQAGVSGICDKPFDPDNVKKIIANLIAED